MRLPHPRLPRRTARLRLAVLCGGVFVLGAASVPAILVVAQLARLARRPGGGAFAGKRPDPHGLTAHKLQVLKMKGAAQLPAFDLRQLLIWSGIALGIAIVAAVLTGWFIAGRILRPLSTITTAARRISASSLHERLALPGPRDELKELGDTLDDAVRQARNLVRGATALRRQRLPRAAHPAHQGAHPASGHAGQPRPNPRHLAGSQRGTARLQCRARTPRRSAAHPGQHRRRPRPARASRPGASRQRLSRQRRPRDHPSRPAGAS